MRRFFTEFWLAARQGPRLYFSPLIGAIKEIKDVVKEGHRHK